LRSLRSRCKLSLLHLMRSHLPTVGNWTKWWIRQIIKNFNTPNMKLKNSLLFHPTHLLTQGIAQMQWKCQSRGTALGCRWVERGNLADVPGRKHQTGSQSMAAWLKGRECQIWGWVTTQEKWASAGSQEDGGATKCRCRTSPSMTHSPSEVIYALPITRLRPIRTWITSSRVPYSFALLTYNLGEKRGKKECR
jgi:hypothetical protein